MSLVIISPFVLADDLTENYSVNASVYPQQLEASPCGIATYDILITNSGEENDTFYLDIVGIPKEWYTLTHDSVSLNPQESKTVYLFVTADCYSKEAEYNAAVSVLGKSDVSVDFVLKVKPDRILEIKTPEKLSACLCENASSAIVVENIGKYEENVALTLSQDASNYAELSESKFTLKSGESKEMELLLKAACDDKPGIKTLELDVKSENSYASSKRTVEIERTNCHDFALKYPEEIKTCVSEPSLLEIEIENTGTKDDLFTVSIDDLNYSESVDIKPGKTEKISTVLTLGEEKQMEVKFSAKSTHKSETNSLKIIAEKCYGVDLQPEKNEVQIESGKGMLLKAKIRNLGTKQDSFKIYSDVPWVSVRPTIIALTGNETQETFAYYSPEYGAMGIYETNLTAESEKSKDVETIKVNIMKEGSTTTLADSTTTTTVQQELTIPKLSELLQNKSLTALVVAVGIALVIFSALYFFVMKGD